MREHIHEKKSTQGIADRFAGFDTLLFLLGNDQNADNGEGAIGSSTAWEIKGSDHINWVSCLFSYGRDRHRQSPQRDQPDRNKNSCNQRQFCGGGRFAF